MSDLSAQPPAQPADQPQDQPRKSRKGIAIAAGGALLVAAAVGGGVWGYQAFFGQGDQPAEALPAKGIVGYAAIDLSPNGEQLLEARATLKKFPGLAKELDLDSKEDLRKVVFEKIQSESDQCPELDYAKDVEPWLGDRMAFAFLDAGKGKDPTGALVFQTTDGAKAEKAAPELAACLDGDDAPAKERTSHALSGDWLVLAQGPGNAEDAVKGAEKASLADDEGFTQWTDAAGDPGILTGYVPELGADRLFESLRADGEEIPQQIQEYADEFEGAGFVGRFRDEGLEVEAASSAPSKVKNVAHGGAAMASLPSSTVAALGFGMPDDWTQDFLDGFILGWEAEGGPDISEADIKRMLKQFAGIEVKDLETLFGEAVVIAVDSGLDADVIQQADPTGVPVGIKIKGDTAAIEKVLDKLRDAAAGYGMPRGFVVSKTAGDYVIVSLSADYADKLADEKGLGAAKTFENVMPEADTSLGGLYVDFDANGWLDELLEAFGAPKDVRDNIAPLSGLGVSTWLDGDVGHSSLTITTGKAGTSS